MRALPGLFFVFTLLFAPSSFGAEMRLLFVDITHADELISSDVVLSSAPLKTFIIDFDSASLEKRQALGADLDAAGILDARVASTEALREIEDRVINVSLVMFDPDVFEKGFFDGPILLKLPTGFSCIAKSERVIEAENGVTTWFGRCESNKASWHSIVFSVFPKKQAVTGTIKFGNRSFRVNATRKKPFHVFYEFDPNYVSEKPVSY